MRKRETMRTVALAVLLALLLPSCGGVEKEDLVGVWRVEKVSGYPEAGLDVLAWIMVFGDNGELKSVLLNLRDDVGSQSKNMEMVGAMLSGKWELSGDSIKVRALSGHDDVIKIERMEGDELVIRHKTFEITLTCRRFADDVDEAVERLAGQKTVIDRIR